MSIVIKSSARLHLGFYNILCKSKNIAYGSLGVALSKPEISIKLSKSGKTIIENHSLVRNIENEVKDILEKMSIKGLHVVINETIPKHVGLGSTTQLMLSVGYGATLLNNLNYTIREIAAILGRGMVSGIGIAAFEKGGFIIDGGRKIKDHEIETPKTPLDLPPIIFRSSLPKNWFFIVIIPKGIKGLSEKEERNILKLPEPMDEKLQYELQRELILGLLPSVVRHDIKGFGKAITRIQLLIGKYFAKYQGDIFCCEETSFIIQSLVKHGAYGVGQSSWGPTAYGITKGLRRAKSLLKNVLKDINRKGFKVDCFISNVRNKGAKVILSE